ncbi:unnamed protein product [Musa hybrid cultivar]
MDVRDNPNMYPKRALRFGLVPPQGGTPQPTDRAAVRRWGLWGGRSTPSVTGSGGPARPSIASAAASMGTTSSNNNCQGIGHS